MVGSKTSVMEEMPRRRLVMYLCAVLATALQLCLASPLDCQVDCFVLQGNERNLCAMWYQLAALQETTYPVECTSFIWGWRSVCEYHPSKLKLTCGNSTMLGITLQATPSVSQTKSLEGGSEVTHCTVQWGAQLAPQMGAFENLYLLDLAPSMRYIPQMNCTHVEWLGGNLTGPLPPEWSHLKFSPLTAIPLTIALQGNALLGPLPVEWSHLHVTMDLSSNRLCGTIPSEWGELMEMVDVTCNDQLSGPPPKFHVAGSHFIWNWASWNFTGTHVEVDAMRLQQGRDLCGQRRCEVNVFNETAFMSFSWSRSLPGIYNYKEFKEVWYCGRPAALMFHVAAVWALMAMSLMAVGCVKRGGYTQKLWGYQCLEGPETPGTVVSNVQDQLATRSPVWLANVGQGQELSTRDLAIITLLDLVMQGMLAGSLPLGSLSSLCIVALLMLPGVVSLVILREKTAPETRGVSRLFVWVLAGVTAPWVFLVLVGILVYAIIRTAPIPDPVREDGCSVALLVKKKEDVVQVYSMVMACTTDWMVPALLSVLYVVFSQVKYVPESTMDFMLGMRPPVWSFWLSAVTSIAHVVVELLRPHCPLEGAATNP